MNEIKVYPIGKIESKPYTKGPDWCCHWPKSYEESSDFDWESEFNF